MMPFQTVLDGGFRKAMGKAAAWFERVMKVPEVVSVLGHVKACAKPMKPLIKPEEKKAAPKQQAAAKPKEVEKEPVNPLLALEKAETTFKLFDFKTYFVNEKDKGGKGIDETIKTVDFSSFTFWYLKYDRYEDEGEVLYKTVNLLNGFVQRCESFRKHALARHLIIGEEGNFDIEGVWLIRGTVIPQEFLDHPQFEYY